MLTVYCIWNLIAFFIVYEDKRRAQRHAWRIRESTFFYVALAFGAAGIWAGMQAFRHKTRHKSFVIGIPSALVLNSVCAYVLWLMAWN